MHARTRIARAAGTAVPAQSQQPTAAAPAVAVETVQARVVALVPEFNQVHVETAQGRSLALTNRTAGIDLARLRLGQAVECTVTLTQPRVIQAQAIA